MSDDTFDRHEIRSSVVQENFGSWLLMRRTESGGWTSVFWCRITAADGMLRVSGDFDPIIFRGHLALNDDPVARVAWMGSQHGLDSYVCEKARAGSGRDACTQWSVEDARADLLALIEECQQEAVSYGEPEESDIVLALREGLEPVEFDGRQGVEQLIAAIHYSERSIDMEMVHGIGARPSNGLRLAHLAMQRLHALLNSEAT